MDAIKEMYARWAVGDMGEDDRWGDVTAEPRGVAALLLLSPWIYIEDGRRRAPVADETVGRLAAWVRPKLGL